MRTDEEILKQIAALEEGTRDWMGTIRGDIIECLPFSVARPFLNDSADSDAWTEAGRDRDAVVARILDYMPFAWDKANNRRGLSAGRSLDHMSAWLWLLGEDQAAEAVTDYDLYGKPHLRAICEHFGWDWRAWDDGQWVNSEDDDNHGVPEQVDRLPFAA